MPPPAAAVLLGQVHGEEAVVGDRLPQLVGLVAGRGPLGEVLVAERRRRSRPRPRAASRARDSRRSPWWPHFRTECDWQNNIIGCRAVLTTSVDPGSEAARANRAGLLALLAEHEEQLALARAGGGERYVARHRARGKLTARERIELLLDRGRAVPRALAAGRVGHASSTSAPASSPAIGVVSGVECVIIAHDPTVRGGAMNPYTLKKNLRALEIARVNRLPVVNLVESGGADLPTQADLFVPAGPDLPRPHRAVGAGHPDDRARVRQLHRRRRVRARACATTPCWSTSGPRCSSAGRRS